MASLLFFFVFLVLLVLLVTFVFLLMAILKVSILIVVAFWKSNGLIKQKNRKGKSKRQTLVSGTEYGVNNGK